MFKTEVNNTLSTNVLAFLSAVSFARACIASSCTFRSAMVAKHVISGPFLFHNNDGELPCSFRRFPLAFGAASSYILTNGVLSTPGTSKRRNSCREDLLYMVGGV